MTIGNSLNASYLHIADTSTSKSASQSSSQEADSSQKTASKSKELSASQKELVAKLRATDTKVRAHEMAHISAGGGVITSGANYTYEKGPDEQLYAVAGEVGIDSSPGGTPEETVTKMETVRAAALAPSDPSPTDYQVASTASILEMQARLEVSRLRQDKILAAYEENNAAANNEESSPLFSNYA
jgi:hypothetical protein